MSAGAKFQPPKWCQTPRSPERHRQDLRWVRRDGDEGAAVAPTPGSAGSASVALVISSKAVSTIGRSDSADVQLKGDLASRMHAAVLQDIEGRKFLVDLKSANGTFLDSKRLTPHTPVRWTTGTTASFGTGPEAERLDLCALDQEIEGSSSPPAKRSRKTVEEIDSEGDIQEMGTNAGIGVVGIGASSNAEFSLYDDLPEAEVKQYVPKPTVHIEPLAPPEEDPTKVLFLDIDGVLRSVHGRQDAFQNARTIEINGARIPLLGNSEAKAGIDFWPSAMRALRHVVQKTGARLVLSSDWRKEDVLKDGVASALDEYRMPALYSQTPDLDQNAPGVLKALHTSVREKRCKEIRKWLSKHPKVVRWVAVDDVDLSLPDKEAMRQRDASAAAEAAKVFLDSGCEFVKCNPTTGFTMELARLAVCFLNGTEVTQEIVEAAYAGSGPSVG